LFNPVEVIENVKWVESILKEIRDVRLRIYEETKNLTPQQRAELTSRTVREFEKEGGITFRRLEKVPIV
jgi:hypothetical protein